MRLTEALSVHNGEVPDEYVYTRLSADEVKDLKRLRRFKSEDVPLFDKDIVRFNAVYKEWYEIV